jgi:hypothetical protein
MRREDAPMALVWKVVELSSVTDLEIEEVLNKWTGQGWTLDNVQFAMRESSKRPSMAFIAFTREETREEPKGA